MFDLYNRILSYPNLYLLRFKHQIYGAMEQDDDNMFAAYSFFDLRARAIHDCFVSSVTEPVVQVCDW